MFSKKDTKKALLEEQEPEFEGGDAKAAPAEELLDSDAEIVENPIQLSKIEDFHGLPQMKKNEQLFFDLTNRYFVSTGTNDVINIIIAYGSKYCVAILMDDDTKYYVKSYSLVTFEEKFSHEVEGQYVKMNIIE